MTSLPTYSEAVIETRARGRLSEYLNYKKCIFQFLNLTCSLAVIISSIGVSRENRMPLNPWNVTVLCKNEEYSYNTGSDWEAVTAVIYIVLMVITCTFNSFVKYKICGWTKDTAIKTIGYKLGIIAFNLLCTVLLAEILKFIFGVPSPYYFSVDSLREYYCEGNKQKHIYDSIMENLDLQHRKSCPSVRASIMGFCLTLTYLYFDHWDSLSSFHATQQTIIVTFGAHTIYALYRSWQDHEHHLIDVVVGVIIGIVQGMMTTRDLFGSVISHRKTDPYVRTHAPSVWDDYNEPTRYDIVLDVPRHQNNRELYVLRPTATTGSMQWLPMDNMNE